MVGSSSYCSTQQEKGAKKAAATRAKAASARMLERMTIRDRQTSGTSSAAASNRQTSGTSSAATSDRQTSGTSSAAASNRQTSGTSSAATSDRQTSGTSSAATSDCRSESTGTTQQENDSNSYYCGTCGKEYEDESEAEELWIGCDMCEQWYCGSCEGLKADSHYRRNVT